MRLYGLQNSLLKAGYKAYVLDIEGNHFINAWVPKAPGKIILEKAFQCISEGTQIVIISDLLPEYKAFFNSVSEAMDFIKEKFPVSRTD